MAYLQDAKDFIASQVFPRVPVQKQADRYAVYDKRYWFQARSQKRAPATESVGIGYKVNTAPTYFCDEWAVHKDIPYEDYVNADDYLKPDTDAVNLCTRHNLLAMERQFFATYLQKGVWQGFRRQGQIGDFSVQEDGQGYWDSPTSDPAADIDRLKLNIKRGTGQDGNVLVLGQSVYYALRSHPAVKDVFKYTRPGIIDAQLLTAVFGVPKVLVAGAVMDTSANDLGDASLDFLTDNDVLLVHAPDNAGLQVPTGGYIFDWVAAPGSGGLNSVVATYDMPLVRAKRVEAMMNFDMRIVGPDLGIFCPKVLEKA
ncbi:MAG: hypothetical protein EOP64_00240 [Sphingomonas sp.]|nr:MAG: hypothetical protein EOP64_00240 [Sphingomonas sp.]